MTDRSPNSPGHLLDDARGEPLAFAVVGLALVTGTMSVTCWAVAQLSLLLTGGFATDASVMGAPRFTG